MRNEQIISLREQQVLQLISKEYRTKDIAQELYISVSTVESHRKNLLSKLDVRNSAGLVRRGFELGYLHLFPVSAHVLSFQNI